MTAIGASSLALGSGAGASAPRVVLTVTPADALVDQPESITVSGLRPRSSVTLTATTRSEPGNVWKSRATFRADAGGRVVVERSPSLGGSYRGRDGMGLFWSMRWNSCLVCDMSPADPAAVRFVASQNGRSLATATVIRRTEAPGVTLRRETLESDGFVGCYFSPRAQPARPGPAVVYLGGSSGGLPCTFRPAVLASHGYPTLVVGYFGLPGLPSDLENIPLEYLQAPLRWLARQPGVDPSNVVVLGLSRGGELALLLGSVYPELVHGVVSYVGSSVAGWSYPGGDAAAWTLGGKAVPPGTEIEVEKIAGPIFLVSGAQDMLWPSSIYASQIVERLRAHRRTDFTSLVYQRAGHLVVAGVPYVPLYDPSFGGTFAGDAQARADSWPKLLAFLARLR